MGEVAFEELGGQFPGPSTNRRRDVTSARVAWIVSCKPRPRFLSQSLLLTRQLPSRKRDSK